MSERTRRRRLNRSYAIQLLGFGSLVVCLTVFWQRRLQTVHNRLRTAVERDLTVATQHGGADRAATMLVHEAAQTVDATPETLVETIERLRAERDDARERLHQEKTASGNARARWADMWWDARVRAPVEGTGSSVLAISIDGTHEDAKALAARAPPDVIAVITVLSDGLFVVSVGETRTDEVTAAEIATEIARRTDGDGGGSAEFAAGRGPNGLWVAAEAVTASLESRLD